MTFPYLEPHKVLAYLHDEVGVRTPQDHVDFYWQWGQKYGCQWARLGCSGILPIGLYADEAVYCDGTTDKVLGVFLNLILWRPKSVRRSRFLLFALRSALIDGPDTLYPFFAKIAASIHLAFKGTLEDGSPLTRDGVRFLLTELRGDLLWHKTLWNCRGGWKSDEACFFCRARSKGDHGLYTEIGLDATWRGTEFKDALEWAKIVLEDDAFTCFLATL